MFSAPGSCFLNTFLASLHDELPLVSQINTFLPSLLLIMVFFILVTKKRTKTPSFVKEISVFNKCFKAYILLSIMIHYVELKCSVLKVSHYPLR